MSGSTSTFGSRELGTNDCVAFRLYCCVFVIAFLGCVAVGQVHAQTLPHGGEALNPGAAAGADLSLSDTMVPLIQAASTPAGNVTTYHYDGMRTGWNPKETILTPGPTGNVKQGSFGVLQTVQLGVATGDTANDYVDAQPLVVKALTINGATQDVVYVATEANNIYAISASSGPGLGTILVQRKLGTPVPRPLNCGNNGPVVGINSTPVIHLDPTDLTSGGTMYVMSYERGINNAPTYKLHALNLLTLADKMTPVTVTASHTLTNNATYTFDATVSRQRPALLEANGRIYAAFGSFCDFRAQISRGWLLGWNESDLTPLAANQLENRLSTSPHKPLPFFLSSIWMSGYGVAAGPSGVLYFVTGNSDPSGTTYRPPNNVQESVVKVSADLTSLLDYFTPTNVAKLDVEDADFGSGGAMVVPDLSGEAAATVVAAGKVGHLYLINRADMEHNTGEVLASVSIGACWCGPSYFLGSDGVRRIVSSGGNRIDLWKAPISPATLESDRSFSITPGQDGGFFTTVSSNGQQPGTAIIWAVGRPKDANPAQVTLYAFDPTAATDSLPVFSSPAGSWPNPSNNSNIVPVVANGKVFVASFAALNIFGPSGTLAPLVVPPPKLPPGPLPSQIFGRITSINAPHITIQPAAGAPVTVDTTAAVEADQSVPLVVRRAVHVFGSPDASGLLWHANSIQRAKDSPALWLPFP
jgi:hypothetical protein